MPLFQLTNDDASGIGSGWKLNFYITLTTTRKNTFSDNALGAANANPVVADGAGRFADIFLETGTYSVVLTDADDVEKWTADPMVGFGSNANTKTALILAISDETTTITTGTAKLTFRMPFAMTLDEIPRASLGTVSSSGTPTFDINESGATILSTKLTIDANEKTSKTAAAAAVLSDTSLADDAEITIDIDVAGTGAAGAKITLIGTAS